MYQFFVDKSDCSRHQIFPGVWVHTTYCQQMMLSLVEMEPHAVVEEHSHPHEQLGILVEGEGEFTVGDQTRHVRPGDMWRIPGGVPHKLVAGEQPVRAIDVFHPIREEYE